MSNMLSVSLATLSPNVRNWTHSCPLKNCYILQIICFSTKQILAKYCDILYNMSTALGGELAVPCRLQTATVGPSVTGGFLRGKQEFARSVDIKVLCNVNLSTVSGWEHSSTTQQDRVPQGCFEVATYKDTVSA